MRRTLADGNGDGLRGSRGESDDDAGGKRQVKLLNLNINLDHDSRSEGERVGSGAARARGSLREGGGIVEKVGPESHLGTGTQIEADDINTGREAKASTQAKGDVQVDVLLERDQGADGLGQRLDDEAGQVLLDDLLGKDINFDVAASGELNVKDSLEVDSSRDGENKVKSNADFDVDFKKAGDIKGEAQVLEDVDRLRYGAGGIEGHLEVSLDSTEVDLDGRREKEVVGAGQVNGTLQGSLGKGKTQVDSVGLSGGR